MKRPCKCSHLEDSHIAGQRCRYCHCDNFRDATTAHTAGLRDLAVHALVIAKKELTATGRITPFFVFRDPEGGLKPFIIPGEAAEIMNSGEAKDRLFGAVRHIVQELKIEAVMFVSDCWIGRNTEKALSMPPEEFLALTRERAFQTAVDQGLVTRAEALTISVQTPTRCMMLNQLYERDEQQRKIVYREVSVMEMDVDEFSGRQKMYGDLRQENLG